jgi:uncharacterized phage protein (TIGR01671 family)
MREILCRGKRKDSGRWIIGYYVKATQGTNPDWIIKTAKGQGGWLMPMLRVSVDPETVGQYTGMKDKNGKRIFEGDILKCKMYKGIYEDYRVSWDEESAAWQSLNKDKSNWICASIWNEQEVVGNIHDNPELMEVEA